jgi:hypothetical protein
MGTALSTCGTKGILEVFREISTLNAWSWGRNDQILGMRAAKFFGVHFISAAFRGRGMVGGVSTCARC